jgi:hypothetical protein
VPLARGQRAGRDCAARLQAGRQSPRPGAPVAAALALLLRDDARIRRHAGLLGATAARGSLGGGGIHPRPAVEPGGYGEGCAGRRTDQEPQGSGRGGRSSRIRAAVADAVDGSRGVQADRQRGNAGHGSGLSGRSKDFDSTKQTGPRGPEVGRTEWHTTQSARQAAPSRPGRTRVCGRLEEPRADRGRDLRRDRRDSGDFLGKAQDHLAGTISARVDAGHHASPGACASAVLAMLMVQYCSGGKWGLLLRRPLEAMSRTLPLIFVLLGGPGDLHEAALPVGAIHHVERHSGGAEGRR